MGLGGTDLGRRADVVGWAGFVVAHGTWDDRGQSLGGQAEAAAIDLPLALDLSPWQTSGRLCLQLKRPLADLKAHPNVNLE